MSAPYRLQLSRRKGFRLPAEACSVARPTRWGNPYPVATYGRAEAIERYRAWLTWMPAEDRLRYLAPLRGKSLACWCPLGVPCHADVLLAAVAILDKDNDSH